MEYYELEQPEQLTKKEKEDAMGSYLMMFAAIGAGLPLPIINLIASVVYFFIQKKSTRFVRFHSLQALLSQIPTTLINAVALYWTLQIWLFKNYEVTDQYIGYLITMVVLNIVYFIFGIIGAIRARGGKMYYFYFFGKLSYHHVYQIRDDIDPVVNLNLPPK